MIMRIENKVAYRHLYARLILSMSLDQAKAVLGFPPSYKPTPEEISKTYKQKAFENHPDRGGDSTKMVEINVAKDILLGKGRATWTPEPRPAKPEPPKVVDVIEGVSFQKATGVIPSGVSWKCISKFIFAVNKEKHWNNRIWTLIGMTDQRFVVVSLKLRGQNQYYDAEKQGVVQVEESWSCNVVSTARTQDPVKFLPKLVKSASVLFEDGTVADPPKKWQVWEGGDTLNDAVIQKIGMGGGVSWKDILGHAGLVSEDDPAVAGRKSVVEIFTKYDRERAKARRLEGKKGIEDQYDAFIRINGKAYQLAEATVAKLDHLIPWILTWDDIQGGKVKNLSRMRGSQSFKMTAVDALRYIADMLTTEASSLHIALEKAIEELEPESKTASRWKSFNAA